jgi:hypothetical protein
MKSVYHVNGDVGNNSVVTLGTKLAPLNMWSWNFVLQDSFYMYATYIIVIIYENWKE